MCTYETHPAPKDLLEATKAGRSYIQSFDDILKAFTASSCPQDHRADLENSAKTYHF